MENSKLVPAWAADRVHDLANRASEEERGQINKGLEALPSALDAAPNAGEAAVDGWFDEHLKRAPVSQNTWLYNALYFAASDLKERIAADAKARTAAGN